jgi:hypothetical protein
MIQNPDPSVTSALDDAGPLHTIRLQIIRDTSLATISSILRYPLNWASIDRPAYRFRALGVTSVFVSGLATFTVGEAGPDRMFTPTSTVLQSVAIAQYAPFLAPAPARLKTCVLAISQLLSGNPSLGNATPERHQIDIMCQDPADVQVWLQEVSPAEDCLKKAYLHCSSFHPGSYGTLALKSNLFCTSTMLPHDTTFWTTRVVLFACTNRFGQDSPAGHDCKRVQ